MLTEAVRWSRAEANIRLRNRLESAPADATQTEIEELLLLPSVAMIARNGLRGQDDALEIVKCDRKTGRGQIFLFDKLLWRSGSPDNNKYLRSNSATAPSEAEANHIRYRYRQRKTS